MEKQDGDDPLGAARTDRSYSVATGRSAVDIEHLRKISALYFRLEGAVEAVGLMPAALQARALDEIISGLIDRVDSFPTDPLLHEKLQTMAISWLLEVGQQLRKQATVRFSQSEVHELKAR